MIKQYRYTGKVIKEIEGTFIYDSSKDVDEYIDFLAWKRSSFFDEAEYHGKITDIQITEVEEIG